jgi:hypothetical protein
MPKGPRSIRLRPDLIRSIPGGIADWAWLYLGHADRSPAEQSYQWTDGSGKAITLNQYRFSQRGKKGTVVGEIYGGKDDSARRVYWSWNRKVPQPA